MKTEGKAAIKTRKKEKVRSSHHVAMNKVFLWFVLWTIVASIVNKINCLIPNKDRNAEQKVILLDELVECSSMVRETWVQSQVASYQKL